MSHLLLNQDNPMFSLVVATRDRSEALGKLFQSLTQQDLKDFEVIIIDQSSSSHRVKNESLVTQFKDYFRISYIWSEKPGLSRSRNLGMKIAAGRFIAFPDDDCWYGETVLSAAISLFSRQKDCDFISGQYSEPGKSNTNFPTKSCLIERFQEASIPSSVTLFVRREVFEALGMVVFDERLGAGTDLAIGEETDLVMRFISSGLKGFYEPDLVIFHRLPEKSNHSIDWVLKTNKARGYLLGKYVAHWYIRYQIVGGLVQLAVRNLGREHMLKIIKARLTGVSLGIQVGRR